MFPTSFVKKRADTTSTTTNTTTSSSSVTSIKKVKTICDYTAQEENELTFKENDVIVVTKEIEGSDWSLGYVESNPDRKGMFPMTFTQPL